MPRVDHDLPLVEGVLTVVFTTEPFDQAAARFDLPRPPGWRKHPSVREAQALMYPFKAKRHAVPHWIVMLRPNVTPGVIAHEALHVVVAINEFVGWPAPKGRNDEPSAYLLETVVDLIAGTRRR
jgi:hypothetical protein